MSTERKGVEIIVGLFLLIGFGVIAVMVIMFGRVGQGIRHYYQVAVEFPNAGGLIKGSDVILSGARIGQVAAAPELIAATYRVVVKLNIREDIRIPRATNFTVASTGLLGDHYVDLQIKPGFDVTDFLKPGERVPGNTGEGLDALASKGGAVMDQIAAALQRIQELTARLNDGVLKEQNLKNIEATFENLRETSVRFKDASGQLETLLTKSTETVDSAHATMKTADGAAGDLRGAVAELRLMIGRASKAVDSTSALIKKAENGGGPLGTLIADRKMAEDLKALVSNLRRSGVLFYKDRPLPAEVQPRRQGE